MSWITVAWIAGGLLLGMMHAAGIWRSARRPTSHGALMGVLRLMVVGLGLTLAALGGGILPSASGWATGFFASVAIVLACKPNHNERRNIP
jgi:hypothetical protein